MVRSLARLAFLSGIMLFAGPSASVYACCGCPSGNCSSASNDIQQEHQDIRNDTKQAFDEDLDAFEDWVIDEWFKKEIVPALKAFTTQMNAVAMHHTMAVGMFIDAKNQLETQRLFQELKTEAHRDYLPSDSFCWFGTNTRSMAGANIKARSNIQALSKRALSRQLGTGAARGSMSVYSDMVSRWDKFRKTYCDTNDNNRVLINDNTGLVLACDHDGPGGSDDAGPPLDEYERVNRDIDYTRAIDLPRTLDVDAFDGGLNSEVEQDVIALQDNLYGNRVLSREITATDLKSEAGRNLYLALRSVAAKRSVAQLTFNAIVGLKSKGTAEEFADFISTKPPLPYVESLGHTRQFLGSILRELYPETINEPMDCTTDTGGIKYCYMDIYELMGEDPSYYSQLEIVGKKMYQNPDFYAKLYDTPANVARKGVAMRAIELMMDREIYESQLRREMIASVLLSSRLRNLERDVNERLTKSTSRK